PGCSGTCQRTTPAAPTPVRLSIPGPARWKSSAFDRSVTTIRYLPGSRRLAGTPDVRTAIRVPSIRPSRSPVAIPLRIALGKSWVTFGSEPITPNCFAYLASWRSCLRSMDGDQTARRMFRPAVGRRLDRGASLDEDVLPVVRGRRALHLARGHERERDPGRAGDHHRHVAEVADVAVVVREREDDVVAALEHRLLDRDPLLLEEA